MCDTLCVVGSDRTLFAKNSDRPVGEVQLVEQLAARPAGHTVRTQYVELADEGAFAVLASRPEWLWGLEHGVNEHRVAIGNERVYTTTDPGSVPPALIGMDLVRLGLERARSADEALEVVTGLLETYGQGGVADAASGEPYFSSFLIADPRGAWVLETSGTSWAAKPVEDGAAISNRLGIGTDWTRASTDVTPARDFQDLRDPAAPTELADVRLAVTGDAVATRAAACSPADLVATLRDHGGEHWGRPGDDPALAVPPPAEVQPDFTGVTVCMHVRDYQATTASMVCELPAAPEAPLRAWVALGSPCVSVYVPVFPPAAVPPSWADPATWERFRQLRDRVEADRDELAAIRAVLGPIEAQLWEEADAVASDPDARARFALDVWPRVEAALGRT